MKRLFSFSSLLLCAAMLSSTVFAADADAYAVYRKCVEKMLSVSSMELSITQKLSMMDGDEPIVVTYQTGGVKTRITSDDKFQMEMTLADAESGEISSVYYKNDYLYEKTNREKFKMKTDMYGALSRIPNFDWDLTRDDLEGATVEKLSGGTKLTYKLDFEDFAEESTNSMSLLLKDFELSQGVEMSFSSITTSLIIGNDGTLRSCASSYVATVRDENGILGEKELKVRVTQSVKIKSLDSVKSIDFPSDLNTYEVLK